MNTQELYRRASAPVTVSGNDVDILLYQTSGIAIDFTVAAPGGSSPSFTISWQRKGTDGVYYPVYSFAAKVAAGVGSQSIGPGLETAKAPGSVGRLAWTVSGSGVSTTVTTGAASATQLVGSTTGMVAGDTLHFATANADRVIASVTDATHVVLTSTVTTIDTEVVTSAAPYIPFSASITGRA